MDGEASVASVERTRGATGSGVGSLIGLPPPADTPSVVAGPYMLLLFKLFLRVKLVHDWLRDALVSWGGEGGSPFEFEVVLARLPVASECVRRTPVMIGEFWEKRECQLSLL